MRDAFDYIVMLFAVAMILIVGSIMAGEYATKIECEARGGVYIDSYCLKLERL